MLAEFDDKVVTLPYFYVCAWRPAKQKYDMAQITEVNKSSGWNKEYETLMASTSIQK
jgi:hypothetical protein